MAVADSQKETIESLTAENAELKEGLDGWHKRFLDCEVERDALTKELELHRRVVSRLQDERDALKADAARYRFIRDGNAYIEPNQYDEDGTVTKEMYMAMETGKYYKDMRDFDMDIDEGITAIAKESKT